MLRTKNNRTLRPAMYRKDLKNRTLPDLFIPAVGIVFLLLALLLCSSVRYGVQNGDEVFAVSEAHRLLLGERWVIDIWSITQFFAVFNYLPLRVFTAATGGYTGVVLFLRYMNVAIEMIFFLYLVFALRKYRWWGLLAAIIFTAYQPIGYFPMSYYTVCITAAAVVGNFFFISPRLSSAAAFFSGFLIACCVIAEPLTAMLYFGYTVAVIIYEIRRKKKNRQTSAQLPQLSVRIWLFLTGGVLLAACGFFAYLFIGTDPSVIMENLFSFFMILSDHPQLNVWNKVFQYLQLNGFIVNIAAVLFIALSLIFRKQAKNHWKLFFACACILFSALTLCMYFKNGFRISAVYMSIYKAVPLTFLGLCSYLFAPKKNNRLFAYLLFGVLISFCMCVVSRVAIGTGLIISVPASLLLLRHMIGQLKENRQANVETENKDNKTKLRKQISYASTAAAMAILLLTETLFCFSVRLYQSPEAFYAKQPLAAGKEGTAYLDRGPLKGIYTLPEIQALYDGVLEDMDRIMAEKPKSLFTMAFCGWPNLYTKLPYGSNSLYDFTTDSLRDELYQLWEERPDKRPDCVYIPFFDPDNLIMDADVADDKLGSLKSAFPCTVQTGKMGYIVHIDWQT